MTCSTWTTTPSACLLYVGPGTNLWKALLPRDDPYTALVNGERIDYTVDAANFSPEAKVTQVDGNVVTVEVSYFGTQSVVPTNYRSTWTPNIDELTLYFGDDGLIYEENVELVQMGRSVW